MHYPIFDFRTDKYSFLFSKTLAFGQEFTQPPVKWIPLLFSGVKRSEREADCSPPSSDKVKIE